MFFKYSVLDVVAKWVLSVPYPITTCILLILLMRRLTATGANQRPDPQGQQIPGVAEAVFNLVYALVPYWVGVVADQGHEMVDMEEGRRQVDQLFANVRTSNSSQRSRQNRPPPPPAGGRPLPPFPKPRPGQGLLKPNVPSVSSDGESEDGGARNGERCTAL